MRLSIRGGSRRARRTRGGIALGIAAGVAMVLLGVYRAPFGQLDSSLHDALFGEQAGSPNVVLVAVGENELDRHGRLASWPRSLHAQVIDHLSEAGANVIVYDFLFADAGPDDATLADAVGRAGNVVLAVAGEPADDGSGSYNFAIPVPEVAQQARALAHSHVVTDGDGRVRRIDMRDTSTTGAAYAPLSLAALSLQFGRDPAAAAQGAHSLDLFGRTIPLEGNERLRVNYVGGVDGASPSFSSIPFEDVLSGSFDPDAVRGRVVFVGVTATGIDRHSAPLLGNAAGVEIQMNALDTMLRDRFLRLAPAWLTVAAGLIMTVLAAAVLSRSNVAIGVALAVLAAGGWVFASVAAFFAGYLVDAAPPVSALMAAAAVALVYRVASERQTQREVVDLFGRHVSQQVVSELVDRADRGQLELGGEVREITVMFCDVRGYTTFSQGLDPAELVGILNQSFDAIVTSVTANAGIVNKFNGDALMAFWNAPHEQPDPAYLACCAARDAILRLARVSGPKLNWGFGITTGPALAGNVGSAGRFEYTLMGETVNTASRLSGAAPGSEIWVDARTRELLAGRFVSEELPPQQLKGMAEPVIPYRLITSEDSLAAKSPERETVEVAS